MQLELNIEEKQLSSKKSKPTEVILLTSRDYEIMSFVCEMKFASIEDIYEKFFKTLRDGSESKSMWWARERITELYKRGYISRSYSFYERKAYYLGTKKGYYELIRSYPTVIPTRPVESINFNTFEHDKLLLSLRLKMEKQNECSNWISDRTLSQFPELCPSIDKSYLPDAIYTTATGEKVAFELEISRKAKKRYHEKIQSYVKCLRLNKDSLSIFKKVIFFVTQESVKDLLDNEIKLYKQYFDIRFDNSILPNQGI